MCLSVGEDVFFQAGHEDVGKVRGTPCAHRYAALLSVESVCEGEDVVVEYVLE